MIIEVTAKFACDDCGTEFLIHLDPAYEPLHGWSVFEVAVDAIRQGNPGTYEDGIDRTTPLGSGSVDDERHYCEPCTKKRDARS